jgi:hypothetical protein
MKKISALFLLLFLPAMIYSEIPPDTPDLLRLFNFNETSGTVSGDQIAGDYITLSGVTSGITTGRSGFGNCVQLTNHADYGVTNLNCLGLTNGMTEFTISLWVKFPSYDLYYSGYWIVRFYVDIDGGHVSGYQDSHAIPEFPQNFTWSVVWLADNSLPNAFFNTVPTLNVWHHIAITWKQGGKLINYFDGVNDGDVTPNNQALKIATAGPWTVFNAPSHNVGAYASYDDVAVFSKEKTPTEILQIKNDSWGPSPSAYRQNTRIIIH